MKPNVPSTPLPLARPPSPSTTPPPVTISAAGAHAPEPLPRILEEFLSDPASVAPGIHPPIPINRIIDEFLPGSPSSALLATSPTGRPLFAASTSPLRSPEVSGQAIPFSLELRPLLEELSDLLGKCRHGMALPLAGWFELILKPFDVATLEEFFSFVGRYLPTVVTMMKPATASRFTALLDKILEHPEVQTRISPLRRQNTRRKLDRITQGDTYAPTGLSPHELRATLEDGIQDEIQILTTLRQRDLASQQELSSMDMLWILRKVAKRFAQITDFIVQDSVQRFHKEQDDAALRFKGIHSEKNSSSVAIARGPYVARLVYAFAEGTPEAVEGKPVPVSEG